MTNTVTKMYSVCYDNVRQYLRKNINMKIFCIEYIVNNLKHSCFLQAMSVEDAIERVEADRGKLKIIAANAVC